MITIYNTKCPSCGADLKIDHARRIAHCDYCGQDFPVEIENETEKAMRESMKRQEELRKEREEQVDQEDSWFWHALAANVFGLGRIGLYLKRFLVFLGIVVILLAAARIYALIK